MDALAVTLEATGAGFDTVVMTNVYLADFDDWSEFNATYTCDFEGRLPPRVTVEVSSLAWAVSRSRWWRTCDRTARPTVSSAP